MLGGGLGTSFMFTLGRKIRVREGSVDRTLVGLTGGETDVTEMDQEYLM